MWIVLAILAALTSGLTTVFAKIGLKNINSNVATFIRTIIILVLSWIIVFIFDYDNDINKINNTDLLFLILSGISTCLLWLCYFKAIQLGNVNYVTPVDKSSIILTLMLSYIFLGESITIIKVVSIVLIMIGTILMINKSDDGNGHGWVLFALLTAVFTSLTALLGKIGIKNINVFLATSIRTIIVFIINLLVVHLSKNISEVKKISKKGWLFLILSGVSTTAAWLFYFGALKGGEASVVFPLEKLSVIFAVLFSRIFLGEKLNKKSFIGLILIILGTLILVF